MSSPITVRHLERDRFAITVGAHRLEVDQPVAAGGDDAGPTPTELFVAGLAGCVAHYARRYCARHQLDPTGLEVTASYAIGDRPARVTDIAVGLTPPPAVPPERLAGLLAVASHCTVHNSLSHPPEVRLEVRQPEPEPAG